MTDQDQPDRPPLTMAEAMRLGELERDGFSQDGCDTLLNLRRRVRASQAAGPGSAPGQECGDGALDD